MATTIDAAQVVADFGAYYEDKGQGEAQLNSLPFEQFETKEAFTLVETEDTVLDEANVAYTEILQPYQDAFTPKGSVTFTPNRIVLQKMKIDQEFNPHKLQPTYLGFLTNNNADVTTWPFIRWFVEMYLMRQRDEDLETKAVYNGVKAAIVPGTAGAAVDVMDGIGKQITNAIAGGNAAIVMGAVPADPVDFVDYIEAFIASIPEKYRYLTMDLNMNRTLRDRYKKGVRKKYQTNYNPTDIENYLVADFENITVKGRPSMQGKNRIWITPKYNAMFGVKGFIGGNSFKIETAKRMVAVFGEWHSGLGFVQDELLFYSDQV